MKYDIWSELRARYIRRMSSLKEKNLKMVKLHGSYKLSDPYAWGESRLNLGKFGH